MKKRTIRQAAMAVGALLLLWGGVGSAVESGQREISRAECATLFAPGTDFDAGLERLGGAAFLDVDLGGSGFESSLPFWKRTCAEKGYLQPASADAEEAEAALTDAGSEAGDEEYADDEVDDEDEEPDDGAYEE